MNLNKSGRLRCRIFVAAAVSLASVLTAAPRPAEAYLIAAAVGGVVGGYNDTRRPTVSEATAGTFFCLLLLPFCILDADAPEASVNSLSVGYLRENGFGEAEISRVLGDQRVISAALQARGLSISRSQAPQDNTPEALARLVRSVHPAVSAEYLSVASQMLRAN